MNPVESIWSFLERLFLERNDAVDGLAEKIEIIRQNAFFITNLSITPQKFNISVEGQSIGLDLFFDPLLMCWKCNMTDAIGGDILTDITMMAGQNICDGLYLKYRATNDNNEIVEQDLVLKGLFVTEPRNQKFDKFERGVESSKYAFASDVLGNCPCAIIYFTNQEASDLYQTLINGEKPELQVGIEDLDYTYWD